MATFQMTLDDDFKANVDELTPFEVKHYKIPDDLADAIRDARERRNLYGSFDTAEEAVASMLEND